MDTTKRYRCVMQQPGQFKCVGINVSPMLAIAEAKQHVNESIRRNGCSPEWTLTMERVRVRYVRSAAIRDQKLYQNGWRSY